MNNHPILGKPPTTNDQRDAIHIAIAPVECQETVMNPGEHYRIKPREVWLIKFNNELLSYTAYQSKEVVEEILKSYFQATLIHFVEEPE